LCFYNIKLHRLGLIELMKYTCAHFKNARFRSGIIIVNVELFDQ